jgi:hypothetical protein
MRRPSHSWRMGKDLSRKRLELLKEAVPNLSHVGFWSIRPFDPKEIRPKPIKLLRRHLDFRFGPSKSGQPTTLSWRLQRWLVEIWGERSRI